MPGGAEATGRGQARETRADNGNVGVFGHRWDHEVGIQAVARITAPYDYGATVSQSAKPDGS
ncbi:hypothetical protein [Mycolicibacterium insubricum]|uniref:hypothetical protein n=1 Tax=Mycolicibacterium insubricum TaxID=444597 RepID=UPI0021F277AF|nr:hypothetical protein [Mycolicibacterium insubricum]MCV7081971.1 hypothetical protein [Mycolicibacterium insubricum]